MGIFSSLILSLLVAGPVSPGIFGRVFQANKQSLLLVQTDEQGKKFSPGFVVGARGEFVFGTKGLAKTASLRVQTSSGAWLRANLIAQNSRLGLGLGRVHGDRPGRFVPLTVGKSDHLKPEQWLVVMAHDEHGQAEPFAGTLRARVVDPSKQLRLELDIPGQRGSPVLSTKGEWVGVVFRPGRRKTKAWPVETVISFLQGVSLDR
jgi:hypothetical protein